MIPAKRSVFLLLFLTAWLGGWFFGEKSAAEEILKGGQAGRDGFLMFWLLGWTVGGCWAAFTWLWMAAGREVVGLRHDALVIRHEVFGVGRAREYELSNVKGLRVAPETTDPSGWSKGMRYWGFDSGPIAFDYGARTIRFGGAVDEAEAAGIIADLKARYAFAG